MSSSSTWTFPLEIEGCENQNPADCHRHRLWVAGRIAKKLAQMPFNALHLLLPEKLEEYLHPGDRELCSVCQTSLTEAGSAARKRAWQSLPATFGLPSWRELKGMKTEAMGPIEF
uniref:Uncharacterized protein n=1 Tax=Mycena chlorophos TaxID=658473 RepID=A0ABQ0LU81_MYCCL|nr:predicted protein [Mycena chlorophos]